MHAVGMALILVAAMLTSGCASAPQAEPVAGSSPAEISAAPGDEFFWRGRNYSLDRMGDAIRAAKHAEGITSVVLQYDSEATVQDIIDVALIARAAGLPAFYQQGGKLNHIEVSR
jgi:biopolymer transport protein ExbD